MARTGIIFGLILCGLTAAAMVETPFKSPMQFVPMMLGIPILFCGVVSLNPHRRKHAMQVAAAIAMLGAIAGGIRVAYQWLNGTDPTGQSNPGLAVIVAMSVVCALFFVICGISLVQSQRRIHGTKVTGARSTLNRRESADIPPVSGDVAGKSATEVGSRENA